MLIFRLLTIEVKLRMKNINNDSKNFKRINFDTASDKGKDEDPMQGGLDILMHRYYPFRYLCQ